MTCGQARSCDVKAGSGGGHRGARRARCAHASFGERRMALSDRCDRPPPVVQARNQPPDAVQSWTSGLLYPRKRADWPLIWGMSVEVALRPALQLLDEGVQDHRPPPVRRRSCNRHPQGEVNLTGLRQDRKSSSKVIPIMNNDLEDRTRKRAYAGDEMREAETSVRGLIGPHWVVRVGC